jgi:hypothetical protein
VAAEWSWRALSRQLAAGQLAERHLNGQLLAAAGDRQGDLLSWPGGGECLGGGRVVGCPGGPGRGDHIPRVQPRLAGRAVVGDGGDPGAGRGAVGAGDAGDLGAERGAVGVGDVPGFDELAGDVAGQVYFTASTFLCSP